MAEYCETTYKSFGRCLKISDGSGELMVTLDVGPRIIYFALKGMENIMCEDEDGKSVMSGGKFAELFGDRQWRIYGGHRLWLSPEDDPRSYYPDNEKVSYKAEGNRFIFTPPPQLENGLQFEIEIDVSAGVAIPEVVHRIKNISRKPKKLSPWAMTVLDEGAVSIMPQCGKDTGLLANRNLSLWAYTDVYDPRLVISNSYIAVVQDSGSGRKLKVGFNNEEGWICAVTKGQLFTKRFTYDPSAEYPDNHCNCECFTNFFMTEIESLGALEELSPGEGVVHAERWELCPCGELPDVKDVPATEAFIKDRILSR